MQRVEDLCKKWVTLVLSAAAILISVGYHFQLPVVSHFTEVFNGYLFLLLAIMSPLAFIHNPMRRGKGMGWYDLVMAVASFSIFLLFYATSTQATRGGWEYYPPRWIIPVTVAAWILLVEGTRRSYGIGLAVMLAAISLYPIGAFLLPGMLWGPRVPWHMVMSYHLLGPESVLGVPMQAFAIYLVGFMVFASALMTLGGGQFFANLAAALLGSFRGGQAKTAVMASAFMASINGSALANVSVTGSFTIPAMIRSGFPRPVAAGIETCAGLAGPLAPPVMGAAAFIMAQYLQIPYAQVALIAVIPTILYYWSLFLQVDAVSVILGIKGVPRAELPRAGQVLRDGWPYLLSVGVLLYFLILERLAMQGAFYSTAVLLGSVFLSKATRPKPSALIEVLVGFGRMMAGLSVLLAMVGMVIGSIALVGTAATFTVVLADLAGHNVILLLLAAAVIGFVLGLGLTITAVYIITAVLLIPPMVAAGINVYSAHLFALYVGMLGELTPPVATSVFVAARIAGAPAGATFKYALRFGIMIYLLPFLFTLQPALVGQGPILVIAETVARALLGCGIAALALEGYIIGIGRVRNLGIRAVLVVGGFLIALPGVELEVLGGILALLALAYLRFLRPDSAAPEEAALEKVLPGVRKRHSSEDVI